MVLRENRHFMFEEDKTTMFILKFNNLNVKTVENLSSVFLLHHLLRFPPFFQHKLKTFVFKTI